MITARAVVLAALVACGKQESAPPTASGSAAPHTVSADAAVTATAPTAPIDAATPDAPSGPVDPASLPELAPAAAGTPAVEIFAVDVPVDWILRELQAQAKALFWLTPTDTRTITGHLAASAPMDAYKALSQSRTMQAPLPGHGATVDIDFVGAPQHDLLTLAGEVVHANIVFGPGVLANVSVRAKRVPASSLVDTLAQLDGRKVLRMGSTWYFLPLAAKPPDVPQLPKRQVKLLLRDASAADAFAALRAVTGATVSACDGQPLSLRFRGDATEAASAILAASGATLSDAPCRLDETQTLDPKTDRFIGGAVSDRLGVSVIERGKAHLLIRNSPESKPPIAAGESWVSVGDSSLSYSVNTDPFPIFGSDYREWLAQVHRTIAVLRNGKHWTALIGVGKEQIITIDPQHWPGYYPWPAPPPAPTIDEHGVHFADPDGGPAHLVPLAHR